jgi:hypothetical protein
VPLVASKGDEREVPGGPLLGSPATPRRGNGDGFRRLRGVSEFGAFGRGSRCPQDDHISDIRLTGRAGESVRRLAARA